MARTFTTTDGFLIAGPAPLPSTGSIHFRMKTTWNSGDGLNHHFFAYATNPGNSVPLVECEKFGNDMFYVGFVTSGNDARIAHSDAGLVTAGVWASYVYDWDDVAGLQHFYIDNVLVGTSTIPFTMPGTFNTLLIGNNLGLAAAAGADIAEFSRVGHVLSSTERALLKAGFFATQLSDLLAYARILGTASPEPETIGGLNFTVNASCPLATHPPMKVPISAEFISSTAEVFEPSISELIIGNVNAEFIPSTAQVFEPSILAEIQVRPEFIDSTSQVFEPSIRRPIEAEFIESTAQVFEPRIGQPVQPGIRITVRDRLAQG